MNAIAPALNPPGAPPRRRGKLKLSLAPAADTSPVEALPPAPIVVPSAPQPVALRLLRRAPENVRHIRPDEDVDGLADNIAAHGLLQSLIGYAGEGWPEDVGRVFVVGGGRRLQALQRLLAAGVVDGDWAVPVLIRDVDDAIELSLAENLDQRTMSPVDEFLAFRALMARGDSSPADLAKRFGWKEREVKKRLRLADLVPEVLDALAQRRITLDAAMAYASSQDPQLQSEVFKIEARRAEHRAHRPTDIRQMLAKKGRSIDDPLFIFTGAEAYERRGGRYDDGLFTEGAPGSMLADPFVLESAAREMADFQTARLLVELRQSEDWSPTIVGHVLTPDLRIRAHGISDQIVTPPGFVKVERWDHAKLWRTIRNNGIEARVVAGIDDKGTLVAWPRSVFVPKDQRAAIERAVSTTSLPAETSEQRAAREREAGVLRLSRRLAVGPFAGTPFEGRAYWPDPSSGYVSPLEAKSIDGVEGQLVAIRIFISNEEVKAQRAAAEAAYQAELDARATEDATA